VFSPAEIQGFLLTQKNDPLQAILEVGAWRDGKLQKKQPNRAKEEVIAKTEPNGVRKIGRKQVPQTCRPMIPKTGSQNNEGVNIG
jgi:hypothetical protein